MSDILKKVKENNIKNCFPTILIAICIFCDLWVLKDLRNYANGIILALLFPLMFYY